MTKRLKEITNSKKDTKKVNSIKPSVFPAEFQGGIAPLPIAFNDGQHHQRKRTKNIKEDSDSPKVVLHAPAQSLSGWLNHNDNHHLGDNNDDINDKLQQTSSIKRENLTQKQLNAAIDYTGGSSDLNRNLIDSHKNGEKIHKYHENTINGLDSLTRQPIGHSLHVYSGIGFDPRNHVGSNGHLHLPAFTSATHDKHVAQSFSKTSYPGSDYDMKPNESHSIHIELHPHDHAAHVSHISGFPSEKETMLPRGTTLKVRKTPTIFRDVYGVKGRTHYVWHATVAHQQDNPELDAANAKKEKATAAKKLIAMQKARILAQHALKFKQEHGRLPDINSADPWEKSMAKGVKHFASKVGENQQKKLDKPSESEV